MRDRPSFPIAPGSDRADEPRLARRAVLGGASLALAGGATGATRATAARRPAPLGLADITVAKPLAQDYAGTLRKVVGFGYTHFGFRLSAYGPGTTELPPREKARLVREAGLKIGVVRFGVRGVDYDRQIEEAAAIGARTIALTVAPVFIAGKALGVATRAQLDAWLPDLAALGAKCRSAGLTLAYHTHWFDFTPLDGEAPIDLMARQIPPRDLSFEIDLAWAWFAGQSPLALLARLGPRVASMHFKDIDRSRGKTIPDHAVVIGRGEMDYAALLPRVRRLTSAIGYVEVDSPDDGLAAAEEGARFFRRTIEPAATVRS